MDFYSSLYLLRGNTRPLLNCGSIHWYIYQWINPLFIFNHVAQVYIPAPRRYAESCQTHRVGIERRFMPSRQHTVTSSARANCKSYSIR